MTNMSDEELDRDWQPSGRRPQSTIARSFSAELMDIFRIENSLTDLDKQVDEKKQTVKSGADELASLEAQIREMEDRLRRSQTRPGILPSHRKEADVNVSNTQRQAQPQQSEAPQPSSKDRSRPGTARAPQQAPGSGAMPPTPGGSEDGDH